MPTYPKVLQGLGIGVMHVHQLIVPWFGIRGYQYVKATYEAGGVTFTIDEISIGRGHRYLTVVLDLQSGAVVFVGDGVAVKRRRDRLELAELGAQALPEGGV